MGYVAFLCGKCGMPLCAEDRAQGAGAACAVCGAPVLVPHGAAPLIPAAAPDNDRGDTAHGTSGSGLADLSALPVVTATGADSPEKQGIQDQNHVKPSAAYPDRQKTFYRLLFCMVAGFALLSAALNVHLLLRLRAADDALRRRGRADMLPPIEEQKRGRINHLAIR